MHIGVQRFAGRYRLDRRLGAGKTGEVLRATDLCTARAVAVKIAVSDEAGCQEALRREYERLFALRHPHLPRVLDYGQDPSTGRSFIAMELVEGEELDAAAATLSPLQLVQLLVQACLGLEFLHRRGLFHGDLKPGNLLVARQEPAAEPALKVIDLSLAGAAVDAEHGVLRGTLRYAAPSVRAGEPANAQSDVFALGATFREAWETVRARAAPGEQAALEPFCRVLERMVAGDPDVRYRSAAQVLKDLCTAWPGALHHTVTPGTPAFVGRGTELLFLESELQALQGRSLRRPVTLVLGEAGIGKSRLLEELRSRAQLRGVPVAEGRCLREASDSFRPLRDVLRHLAVVHEGTGDVAALLHRTDDLLGAGGEDDRTRFSSEALYARQYHHLCEALARVTETRPLLVTIEDLEEGDAATLEFLARTSRRRDRCGFWFVAACRDQTGSEHPRAVSALARSSHCGRLELSRLAEEATRDLVRSLLPAETPLAAVARVAGVSEGHPEYAELAARAVQGRWLAAPERDLEHVLEESLSGSLTTAQRHALDALSLAERGVARQLSVLVRPFTAKFEERFLGGEGAGVLDSLVRSGVLRLSHAAGKVRYSFRSDSLRALLYEELEPGERRDLHRRAADVARHTARDPARRAELLAVHFLRGGSPGEAIHFGILALRQMLERHAPETVLRLGGSLLEVAEPGAPCHAVLGEILGDAHQQMGESEPALRRFVAAFRALRPLRDPGDLARLQRKIATALAALGEERRAFRVLQRALQCSPDPTERARLHESVGELEYREGNLSRAREHVLTALEQLGEGEEDLLAASLWNDLGIIAHADALLEEAQAHHRRALAIRERCDDVDGKSRSLANLGLVAMDAGRHSDARDLFQEAIACKRRLGNRQTLAATLVNLGHLDHWMGRFGDALRWYEESLELCTEIAWQPGRLKGHCNLAQLWLDKGRLGTALEEVQKAEELAARGAGADATVEATLLRGSVELTLGRGEAALRLGREGLARARAAGLVPLEAAAHLLLGEAGGCCGVAAEAMAHAARAVHLLRRRGEPQRLALALVVQAEVSVGQDVEAARTAREGLQRAEELELLMVKARAQLVLGRLASLRGAVEEAAECYHACVAIAERLHVPELRWRVYAELGLFHRRSGRRERAHLWMRRCLSVLRDVAASLPAGGLQDAYLAAPPRAEILGLLRNWLEG